MLGRREAHRVGHVDAGSCGSTFVGSPSRPKAVPRPWRRRTCGAAAASSPCAQAAAAHAERPRQRRAQRGSKVDASASSPRIVGYQWPPWPDGLAHVAASRHRPSGAGARARPGGGSPVHSQATRAGRMLVPARVACSRRGFWSSRTFTTLNMPPISIGAERARCRSSSAACCRAAASPSRPCRPCRARPSPCSRASSLVIFSATPRWSTPIMVGTSWPIAFIVWCDLWQWNAQSPGDRVELDGAHLADGDVGRHLGPARALAAPSRRRCRSPRTRGRACGSGGWSSSGCRCGCAPGRRCAHTSGSMPGKTRLFQVHRLKSSIVLTLRRGAARLDVVGVEQEARSRGRPCMLPRVLRMDDEQAHHAHRHLHHLVGVRVVHERARPLQRRTRRRRSCRAGCAAASARRRRPCRWAASMPCQWTLVCSGSLLVTKMRTRSPSTTSIVGPGLWPL